jgi:hypothetical protein
VGLNLGKLQNIARSGIFICFRTILHAKVLIVSVNNNEVEKSTINLSSIQDNFGITPTLVLLFSSFPSSRVHVLFIQSTSRALVTLGVSIGVR